MSTNPISKVVFITGAAQGLGLGILKVAAQRDPSAIYILACRNVTAGQEAVEKLRQEGVKAEIDIIQFDVVQDKHIIAAVEFVEKKYGKLDVLVNNAGILGATYEDIVLQNDSGPRPLSETLPALRAKYANLLSVNLTSVAAITEAFFPLLHKSALPKVVNVTSGLGSMTNSLTRKMGRAPPYGASKIGMNGLTVHLQVTENDRIEMEKKEGNMGKGGARVRFYLVAPGVLRTNFMGKFLANAPRSADEGAEVAVRLINDESGKYEGAIYWEFNQGEMKEVPW